MDKNHAKTILEEFLSFPLSNAVDILNKFSLLDGAISRFNEDKRNFVYVPGPREDRVVLVAHADTVWDEYYKGYKTKPQKTVEKNGVYRGKNGVCGIGADDRAGCAVLWLLRDLGHSLLILDGEERGQIGANYLKSDYPDLFDELNAHSYMLQFDRRGYSDFKVYDLPVSEEFLTFIKEKTLYSEPNKNSRTDIVVLCEKICGANLSVGYYNEHTPDERLDFGEWFRTLTVAEDVLTERQTRFPLKKRRD